MHYTVVDIETTGLSRFYHRITEIAALQYRDGRLKNEFTTLVNPQQKIPRFITRLTGIDNEMVKDAPLIQEIIPKFHIFLADTVFIGHNSTFDYKFLDYNLAEHHDTKLTNPNLCTCKLARRLLPELPSKKLASLCDFFDIKNINAHRAKADALATADVFHNFLPLLKEKEITDIKDILAFQKSKIPKTF